MTIEELQSGFINQFGSNATNFFFSPGRINLIGEHTDYNGGHVFPAAISLGTYAAVASRSDRELHFFSANYPTDGELTVNLSNLEFQNADKWTNYAKGMFKLIGEKFNVTYPFGLNIFIQGDLPSSSGLSSSASMELLLGIIIKQMYTINIGQLELVKIGQQVENSYIGVNSGIMDQFAVGMGKQDQAIFLDTNTLDYLYFPLELSDYRIIIMNTNKPRDLINSKYNERRNECETALQKLQTKLHITKLGDLDANSFDEYSYLIHDKTLIKRARHAVLENQRTIEAGAALQHGDLQKFGRLMNASHISLEFDYEVTGIELDTLVHTAWTQPGVLGARMTGAGFGGCALALVTKDLVEPFKINVAKVYAENTDYQASFYVAKISAGSREIFS